MRKRKFTCAEWPAGVLGKRSYINKNAPLKQPNISAEEHSPLVLTSCAQTSTLQSLSGALRVMQYDSKKKKKECLALNTSCYVARICVVSLVIGSFIVGDLFKHANQRWTGCGVLYGGPDEIRYCYENTCFLASCLNKPPCKISRCLVQERCVKNVGRIPKVDCIL